MEQRLSASGVPIAAGGIKWSAPARVGHVDACAMSQQRGDALQAACISREPERGCLRAVTCALVDASRRGAILKDRVQSDDVIRRSSRVQRVRLRRCRREDRRAQ